MRLINYSIKRMTQLDPFKKGQHFHAVHVAGTNGKTSVCYYLSNMLHYAGVKWGRFTSPHMGERSGAIVVNGRPLTMDQYRRRLDEALADYAASRPGRLGKVAAKFVKEEGLAAAAARQKAETDEGLPEHLALSPFEADTAVAMREFDRNPDVEVAVIEAGMGGWQDATNILSTKALTVITPIDFDHIEYLGNTIQEIAQHKARIMRPGVPCVHAKSSAAVFEVLQQVAVHTKAPLMSAMKGMASPLTWLYDRKLVLKYFPDFTEAKVDNLAAALLAFRLLAYRVPSMEAVAGEKECVSLIQAAQSGPQPPGRLHGLVLPAHYGRKSPIFVDGAHNVLGFRSLKRIINGNHAFSKSRVQAIVWIVAASQAPGRNPGDMRSMMRMHDGLAAVEYEMTEDAPEPYPAAEVINAIRSSGSGWNSPLETSVYRGRPRLADALRWAVASCGENNLIVVTGSLYLTNELIRLVARERDGPQALV